MKKTRMFLLGSSMCAAMLTAAVAAEAADDVVVEPAAGGAAAVTTETTTTTTKDEEAAKPRGFYAGGSIGGSFFDKGSKHSRVFNRTNNPNTAYDDAFTVDKIDHENNFMWTVFVGYRMADWLGAEVGWTDLGGFRAFDEEDLGPGDTVKDKVSPSVDGLEARLRAWLPLGTERIQGIGGLGVFIFQSQGEKRCQGTNSRGCTQPAPFQRPEPALDPREDSGQALTISAGLQFSVTDNILIRTEYQHFFSVLDRGVDMVTASVVFGFYDFFGQGKAGGADDMGGVVVE